jgi:hypothetical protein
LSEQQASQCVASREPLLCAAVLAARRCRCTCCWPAVKDLQPDTHASTGQALLMRMYGAAVVVVLMSQSGLSLLKRHSQCWVSSDHPKAERTQKHNQQSNLNSSLPGVLLLLSEETCWWCIRQHGVLAAAPALTWVCAHRQLVHWPSRCCCCCCCMCHCNLQKSCDF